MLKEIDFLKNLKQQKITDLRTITYQLNQDGERIEK